jgi:hypothetical protein
MKTQSQIEKAAEIVLRSLTKMDRECIKSIDSIHEMAKEHYAINIWCGVVDRHAMRIAKETEGEVVVNRLRDREQVAWVLHNESRNK